MSANTISLPQPPQTAVTGSLSRDAAMQRFAVHLALIMALFLLMVPSLGTMARVPFLLLFIPLVFWSAFADTERAIYVLCAWCWMDGTIRGLFGSGVFWVLARDTVLLLILIGWGGQRLRTRAHNPLRFPPGTLVVSLFVLNCLLQIANPDSLGIWSSLMGLKMHLTPIPLLFVGYDIFRRREQVRSFFLFLALATLIIASVSIVQYVQGPGWTYAHFPGSKNIISQNINDNASGLHDQNLGFKPPGTTTFGGGVNAYITFAVPMTFALLLLSRKLRFGFWPKMGFVGILFALTIALFLNGVRSALVSSIACLLICSVLMGGWQMIRTLGAVGACLVLGFGAWTYSQGLSSGHVATRFSSTFTNPIDALHQDRQTFFEQVSDLAVEVPMGNGLGKLGAGAGQIGADPEGDFAPIYFSESYLGCMIIETGILGALLIAGIALFFIGKGFLLQQQIKDPDSRLLAAALVASLLVIFANFFTTPILFQPPGSILFWLCAAILMRVFTPVTLKPISPRTKAGVN